MFCRVAHANIRNANAYICRLWSVIHYQLFRFLESEAFAQQTPARNRAAEKTETEQQHTSCGASGKATRDGEEKQNPFVCGLIEIDDARAPSTIYTQLDYSFVCFFLLSRLSLSLFISFYNYSNKHVLK